VIGARALGFYATAYQVVQIPEFVLGSTVRTAVLPALVRSERDEAFARTLYLQSLGALSLVAAPVLALCTLSAEPIVRLVLGAAWAPAAPVIAILAPLGLVQSYFQLNTAMVTGLAQPSLQLRMSIITSLLGMIGIVAGLHWGPRAIALGYAAGATLAGVLFFNGVRGLLGLSWSVITQAVARPFAATAVMVFVVLAYRSPAAGLHASWARLAQDSLFALTLYAMAMAAMGPRRLARDVRELAMRFGVPCGVSAKRRTTFAS
jgi:lipopolysaccharide exporter